MAFYPIAPMRQMDTRHRPHWEESTRKVRLTFPIKGATKHCLKDALQKRLGLTANDVTLLYKGFSMADQTIWRPGLQVWLPLLHCWPGPRLRYREPRPIRTTQETRGYCGNPDTVATP